MDFFTDFKAINKVVFKKTRESYVKNLLLIPMFGLYVAVYVVAFAFLMMTLGQLGSAGGFLASMITWFFSCYLISDYLTHLQQAISGFKFKFKDVGKSYMNYFMPLLTATAVPRIVVFLFSTLTRIYIPYYWIIIFYVIYATFEIVYQKHIDHLEMFAYGHQFLKENWLHWLIINAIHGTGIGIFIYLITRFVITPLALSMSALPGLLITAVTALTFAVLIGIPLLFYFIYRGYIFKILSVSSRRKREYMRNIYGN